MLGNFDVLTPSIFVIFIIANVRVLIDKHRNNKGNETKFWKFFEVYQDNKVSGVRVLLIVNILIRIIFVLFGLAIIPIFNSLYGFSGVTISVFVSYFYFRLLYLSLYRNTKTFIGAVVYWIITITVFIFIWLGVVPILGMRGSNISWKLLIVFVTAITPLAQFIRTILDKDISYHKDSLVFFREVAIFLFFILGVYLVNVSVGLSIYFIQNPQEQTTKINKVDYNLFDAKASDFTALHNAVLFSTRLFAGGQQFLSNSDPSVPVRQLEEKGVKKLSAEQTTELYPILAEATLIQFCYTVIGFALIMDWISRRVTTFTEHNSGINPSINGLTKETLQIEAILGARKSQLIEKRKPIIHRKG